MNNLDNSGFDSTIFKLGSPCSQGHMWQNTSLSLRYIKGGQCTQCMRLRATSWQKKQRSAQRAAMQEETLKGSSGSQLHRTMTDLIRCRAKRLLELDGWKDIVCLTVAPSKLQCGRIPDATFIHPPSRKTILVEVGQYQPCKWDSSLSVIHVGFNRRISQINFEGHEFELALFTIISGLIHPGETNYQPYFPLRSSPVSTAKTDRQKRDKAIWALLTSGVSASEISQTQISDYNSAKAELKLRNSPEGVLWLSPDASFHLSQWLKIRQKIGASTSSLFLSLDPVQYGTRLSSNSIRELWRDGIQESLDAATTAP